MSNYPEIYKLVNQLRARGYSDEAIRNVLGVYSDPNFKPKKKDYKGGHDK